MSRRGPYAKGAAKREEILDVALEVVAERGCRNAVNREIAERVGLSQAGLMHYFHSREDLYMAVLSARDERDIAEFWAPKPTIRGYLDVIAHNATVPGLVQLYVEFSAEASIGLHPAHGFFLARNAWVREQLSQSMRAAQDAGELGRHIDIAAAADLLIAAADGMQQQWLLDRSIDMVGRLEQMWDGLVLVSNAGAAAR